jgi:signal transduction histidine kinase
MTLRREPVALDRIVQNALDVARPLIEGRGQRFIVTMPGRPIILDADLARLSQAILNLLDNAAKFTPQGVTISLDAREEAGALVLTIADNGVGIPREKLPEIFEMFAQLDRTHERPYSGLGVGLSLARRLVELHGGTLVAESEGTGRGSRFTIRLPVLAPPGGDGSGRALDEAEPPAQGDAAGNGAAGRAGASDPLSSSEIEVEPTEPSGGASP